MRKKPIIAQSDVLFYQKLQNCRLWRKLTKEQSNKTMRQLQILSKPQIKLNGSKAFNHKDSSQNEQTIKTKLKQSTKQRNESISLTQISLINKTKININVMDNEEFFINRQQIFSHYHKTLNLLPYNTSLNPWTEHELANPYLNSKKIIKSKSDLKKLKPRKKVLSVDQLKNSKVLFSFGSKEMPEHHKIPRQLPKLNIDKLIADESYKKRKMLKNQTEKQLLNSSPLYHSSPTIKKLNQLNYSSQKIKKPNLLPSVSRELNITRKIYLLQNKLNSNSTTSSPTKKSFLLDQRKQDGGDIRRLVEKEWSKKL